MVAVLWQVGKICLHSLDLCVVYHAANDVRALANVCMQVAEHVQLCRLCVDAWQVMLTV